MGTDERRHGCCVRIIIFPVASMALMGSLMLSVVQFMHYLLATLCEIALKVCCVEFVCPRPCGTAVRRLVVCPCRWLRVSWTGKGHLGCCYDEEEQTHDPMGYVEHGNAPPALIFVQPSARV